GSWGHTQRRTAYRRDIMLGCGKESASTRLSRETSPLPPTVLAQSFEERCVPAGVAELLGADMLDTACFLSRRSFDRESDHALVARATWIHLRGNPVADDAPARGIDGAGTSSGASLAYRPAADRCACDERSALRAGGRPHGAARSQRGARHRHQSTARGTFNRKSARSIGRKGYRSDHDKRAHLCGR